MQWLTELRCRCAALFIRVPPLVRTRNTNYPLVICSECGVDEVNTDCGVCFNCHLRPVLPHICYGGSVRWSTRCAAYTWRLWCYCSDWIAGFLYPSTELMIAVPFDFPAPDACSVAHDDWMKSARFGGVGVVVYRNPAFDTPTVLQRQAATHQNIMWVVY